MAQPKDAPALLPIGIVLLNREPNAPFKPKLSGKRLVGKTNYKATASQSLTIQLEPPAAGKCYAILPSTFEPEQFGSFTITVSSEDDPAFTLSASTEPPRLVSGKGGGGTAPAPSSSGAATRLSAKPAPPAPPSGKIKPEEDPVLSAVLAELREAASGPFDDPDFKVRDGPPGPKGVGINNKILFEAGHPGPNNVKIDAYHRLSEFPGKGPATSGVGSASLMIHRRAVHDLWLLSAIGMVSTRPDLLSALVAYHDESAGLAALRFFKDGEWRTVVVDDQMPCHGKLKLAYSSNSEPRDGPVALVSKGLAKLYKCYEELKAGRVGSALEDLTGGYADKLYLRDGVRAKDGSLKQPDINVSEELASGVLWVRLKVLLDEHHLLGAVYKAKYAALGGASAIDTATLREGESLVYPVLELREVSEAAGGGRFVKLRNPWKMIGEGTKASHWEGPWGQSLPGGAEWNNMPGVAKELGGKPREAECAFWMPFEDFVTGFNKVHICRILSSPAWHQCPTVRSEWTRETAGGKLGLPPGPGAPWRTNSQYILKVAQRCTVLVALAQPDALLDANDALDGYQIPIGFTLLSADASTPLARKLLIAAEDVRYDSRLACTRQVNETLELDAGTYVVLPYTDEPNTFLPYTLSVAATAPVTLEMPDATAPPSVPTTLRGAWSVAHRTAGGCPNAPELWTSNPQFLVKCDGPCSAVGVLSLDVSDEEAERMEAATMALTAAQQLGDAAAEADAQAQLSGLAPSIGFFVLRSAGGGQALSGTMEISKGDIITASPYQHGTQEVAALMQLPAAGEYLLFLSTFDPNQEANFKFQFHVTGGAGLAAVRSLSKGCELVDAKRAAAKPGAARPQGAAGPPGGAGGKRFEPPAAKHDVSAARAEEGEGDGKMGYAQRMELEEAKALKGWVENVPMMTIEGQPLSENVKKARDAAIKLAMDQCRQTGRKFEDTTWPMKPGRAEGEHQPQVYKKGYPTSGMPVVTQWLRPEEFVNNFDPRYPESPPTPRQPMLFKSLWEVEGIIQGASMDNKWFVSTLNIVSANRGQLDRIFFGEVDPTWVTYGFYVCKFYQDDPASDDDWHVVLVDDRIPCDANGNPVFCRHPDQRTYWGMIIEKAYAKFAGCYEAMQGGTVTQGLEDLTGGIGYKFDLEKREKDWVHPDERLWDEMMEKMKTEHVIGCANNTKGQPRPNTTKKGIELNRAYAVVTGGDFEDRKLMRLRIPLSPDGTAKEWNGRWSDKSGQWSSRMMQMLHYSRDDNDGTFWMEYADFCKHFNKVYMCRMLDDLWTRYAVKSRWMDETAGGCTNFISWRNNNQWLLRIDRPNTKLIIKLTQPDARKSSGNGRHYSNAIGFYIFRGNAPNRANDHLRRKLVLKPGDWDEELMEGGDFVFTKEPRYTRQVCVEYTFEKPSATPYVLMPSMFEPGRESLFKLTILSDDRDDDGIPDFGFSDVKPEDDWRSTRLTETWSNGGEGNPMGVDFTAGGPPEGPATSADGKPLWLGNMQFQISLMEPTRCFLFLEMLNVKTDMRDVEGLQTEPAYPTVGFNVYKGRGNHIKLDGSKGALDKDGNPDWSRAKPLTKLFECKPVKGDGCYLELGHLESTDENGERLYYVVIPFTSEPNVEHKWQLTLYSDYEHDFVKIDPRLNCDQCGNPSGMFRVLDTLDRLEALTKRVLNKEKRLAIGDDGTNAAFFTDAARAATADQSAPKVDYGYADLMPPPQPTQPTGADAGTGALGYSAAAASDGGDAVDVSDIFNELRPLDDAGRRAAAQQQQETARLEAERQEMQAKLQALRAELAGLGMSQEDIDRATKKGSTFCSVM